jgi:hypothetical protein
MIWTTYLERAPRAHMPQGGGHVARVELINAVPARWVQLRALRGFYSQRAVILRALEIPLPPHTHTHCIHGSRQPWTMGQRCPPVSELRRLYQGAELSRGRSSPSQALALSSHAQA